MGSTGVWLDRYADEGGGQSTGAVRVWCVVILEHVLCILQSRLNEVLPVSSSRGAGGKRLLPVNLDRVDRRRLKPSTLRFSRVLGWLLPFKHRSAAAVKLKDCCDGWRQTRLFSKLFAKVFLQTR